MKRWHAYWQLLLARFRIFYREPIAVFWVYGFPILMAVSLGVAFASREPARPPVDLAGNPEDSRLKQEQDFLQKEGFPVEIHEEAAARDRLITGDTSLVIHLSDKGNHYEYDKTRADGVLALRWVDALLLRKNNPNLPPPVMESQEEPGNRYIDFLLPGLMGLNLLGGGLWGVGFVVVDYRIRKLLKRMLATPMNRGDFLLSIMSARLLFLIPEQGLLLLFGWFVFGVPVRGNILLLPLIIILGSAAFSGIGLLIACRTEKIETVSGLMNLVMLPMWIMGGAFFSPGNFPAYMQPIVQALPLTQVTGAMREVMLKGYSLDQIAWRLAILAAWAVITFALALRFFRWR